MSEPVNVTAQERGAASGVAYGAPLCAICGQPAHVQAPVRHDRAVEAKDPLPDPRRPFGRAQFDAVHLCRNPECRAELTARVKDGRYYQEHAK